MSENFLRYYLPKEVTPQVLLSMGWHPIDTGLHGSVWQLDMADSVTSVYVYEDVSRGCLVVVGSEDDVLDIASHLIAEVFGDPDDDVEVVFEKEGN